MPSTLRSRTWNARSSWTTEATGGPAPIAPPGTATPSATTLVRELLEARRPATAPEQLVHGDLLGNVLYAPGLTPAVIDWPPYWRPPAWATAVAVADALCWNGAEADLLDRWAGLSGWPQMLVRALLFRILTDREAARSQGASWEPHPAYRPVAERVLARVES
ncbi:hypothetical protein GCM10029992_45530 [Glycomyces albus]